MSKRNRTPKQEPTQEVSQEQDTLLQAGETIVVEEPQQLEPEGWEPETPTQEPAEALTPEQEMDRELDAQVAAGTLVRNEDGSYSMPRTTPSPKSDIAAALAAVAAKPARGGARCEVQNGQRKPKPGGKCAAVWQDCDELVAAGHAPTPDLVKALAAQRGDNLNNATIELYAWRKYHGITGRVVQIVQVAVPATNAAE